MYAVIDAGGPPRTASRGPSNHRSPARWLIRFILTAGALAMGRVVMMTPAASCR